MQLTPRYGPDPLIVLDGPPAAVAGPTIAQRARLAETVAAFADDQWAHPSRCDGWSNRDVIAHLDSTNGFWAHAVRAGLTGEPTRLLATFDPVATPAALVAATHGLATGEVLDRFTASTKALADLLGSLDEDDWSMLAEAPPGHVSISALAHHALWDSWVHERDILVPMGVAPDVEPDEIAPCLRYAAALSPAFAVATGTVGRGHFTVDATDPAVTFVVEIGDRVAVRDGGGPADLRLTGGAVDLLEALSIRRPLTQPVPPDSAWMLRGIAEAFDAAPG